MVRPISRSLAAALMALMTEACAGGPQLPALPELPGTNEPLRVSGPVSEVYMRLAHGATACWFGADGALKASHIFHAEVEPPSRGGTAEVTVHEIDRTQPSPWGRRAFRVQLVPADGATSIAVENFAMPEEVASRMRRDVFQWLQGKAACTTNEAPALSGATAAASDPARPSGPPAATRTAGPERSQR